MEKKKTKNILLTIMGVLILAELAIAVYRCIVNVHLIYQIADIVALVGIALYGFFLYKKPHGNMLKYAMLLSALSFVLSTIISIYEWSDPFIEVFLPIFAACLLFYVAGRLNRIEQNKFLLPIIAVILFVCCIINWVSYATNPVPMIVYLRNTYPFVAVLTLMIAYFVRYKEHKEAGLIDAPKK